MIFLAQAYSYTRPFLQPLPIWNQWYLLLFPLCVAIAVVYKSIKCSTMKRVPVEAAQITLWILLGFSGTAAVLVCLSSWLSR